MKRTVEQLRWAKLLSAAETAERLGISRTHFYAILDRLRAGGLRFVLIPSPVLGKKPMRRYVADSIDRLIANALKREKDEEAMIA